MTLSIICFLGIISSTLYLVHQLTRYRVELGELEVF
jgi:hypothetical protein